jgi:shikimate kinase
LIGMAGSGKTTIGRETAELLGRPFIDVDGLIEQRFGPIPELFKQGEVYFRQCESQAIVEACTISGAVIATGGGVITQPQNMTELKKAGVILFIDRPIHKIVADIDVSTRPLFICGIEALNTAYTNRLPLYRQYADIIVENNGSVQDACLKVLELSREGKL